MQAKSQDKIRLLVFIAAVGVFIAILMLLSLRSIVGAQHDPNKPPFEGVLVPAPSADALQTGDPIELTVLGPEWRPQFSENFESQDWEDKWDINLDGSSMGYKWGTRVFPNSLDSSSTRVGWGVGGGTNGSALDPVAPAFPAGVKTWLVAGPINLANATDALVNLDLFYESDGNDPFTISVSQDRYVFNEEFRMDSTVPTGSWQPKTVSLLDYVGKPAAPQVWIAFIFSSTDGSPDKIGAMMDNVDVMVEGEPFNYLPLIAHSEFTPEPTATATPIPGGDYYHDFTNDINPWTKVRWTNGASSTLSHDSGSDTGNQGFLNYIINNSEAYSIASPLYPGPDIPYNIETVVKLRSPRETGDQYGIIFGANYNGGVCPATDFSTCFTQYYEMRVRYYIDGDKTRMDMKLKRIDSHDSNNNNQGPDLIEWTRVANIDEDSFIEWDITVSSSGKISISADDQPVASATDSTYLHNTYFGVIIRNDDKSNDAEAKFDFFKVD